MSEVDDYAHLCVGRRINGQDELAVIGQFRLFSLHEAYDHVKKIRIFLHEGRWTSIVRHQQGWKELRYCVILFLTKKLRILVSDV